MIELFQELGDASALLQSALQRYHSACVALQSYCQSSQLFDPRQTLRDATARELVSVSSHELTLRSAKSIVSQVGNTFSPIHALPAELLGSIFSLVVGSHPCGTIECSSPDIDPPKFPYFFLRVCSRWRHVALSTSCLWTHIDLAPGHLIGSALAERAELATAHSGGLLLDIHIRETNFSSLGDKNHVHSLDLIEYVATRIRSLEFTIPETVGFLSTRHKAILECCLSTCVPGTLDELAVKQHRGSHMFLEVSSVENLVNSLYDLDDPDRPLAVPMETVEDLLLPITSLTLENIFFPWSYSAYRSLTELRLICSTEIGIRVPELIVILTSSPGLRVFHYGLDTDWLISDLAEIVPVHLQSLEVLKMALNGLNDFGLIAPLLAPGSRPLQLFFGCHGRLRLSQTHPITKFMERSNAAKIHIREASGESYRHGSEFIDNIIHASAQLQTLVLERFAWATLFTRDSEPTIRTSSRLNGLCLLECDIDVGTLRRILESYQVKTLTLWKCIVAKDVDCFLSGPEIEEMFSDVCSNIQISSEDPSPVVDWW